MILRDSNAWGEPVDGWLTDGAGSGWSTQVLKSDQYTRNEDSDAAKACIPSGDIYYPDSDPEEKALSETIAAQLEASSCSGQEEALMESVDIVASTFGGLVGDGCRFRGLRMRMKLPDSMRRTGSTRIQRKKSQAPPGSCPRPPGFRA